MWAAAECNRRGTDENSCRRPSEMHCANNEHQNGAQKAQASTRLLCAYSNRIRGYKRLRLYRSGTGSAKTKHAALTNFVNPMSVLRFHKYADVPFAHTSIALYTHKYFIIPIYNSHISHPRICDLCVQNPR